MTDPWNKVLPKNFVYLILILVLSFVLPRLIPGSPLFFSQEDIHVLNANLPPESFHAFQDYYAPEKSILEQLGSYGKHLLKGDLGYSFYYKLPVLELVLGRIGWTLFLSLFSIVLSSLLGVFLGTSLALMENPHLRRLLQATTSFLQGIPVMVIAILVQTFFCYQLNLFPASGAYSAGVTLSASAWLTDVMRHATVPLLVLFVAELPPILLLSYNISQKIKMEDYVEMARYLNLNSRSVKYGYVLKNGMPEIMSKINIQFLYAISGSMFVESVFSYPGMGSLLKTAAFSRDYVLLQGILLVMGLYSILINAIFHLMIRKMDPRY